MSAFTAVSTYRIGIINYCNVFERCHITDNDSVGTEISLVQRSSQISDVVASLEYRYRL